MTEPYRWRPLSCEQIAGLLEDAAFPWWICGGHSIDLLLGRETRAHGDVDIGILRGDQPALFDALAGFEVHLARDGRLRELTPAERKTGMLGPDHHCLWCRPRGASDWALEVLLNDGGRGPDGQEWIFRREPAVRRPLREIVERSPTGLPYLAPEVQLLFKAKQPREKDEQDFALALPALSDARRAWLRGALAIAHPGHPWIAACGAGAGRG